MTPNQLANFNVSYTHFFGAGTVILKQGSGFLQRVCVNTPVTGTITLYDNTVASGAVIAVLTLTAGAPNVIALGVPFNTGLSAIVVGAQDLTFVLQ